MTMNNICLNFECDNTLKSYSFISNFLKKLSLHEYFSDEELKKVTYTIKDINGNSDFYGKIPTCTVLVENIKQWLKSVNIYPEIAKFCNS